MDTTDLNQIIKNQFDKQSQNFSNWSITKNTEYMQAYSGFCMINSEDTLLDVACGTGEFVIYLAPKINSARGVDISQGMIDLAVKQAAENKITNVDFLCSNVESLSFDNESFSIVVCKSAFHHFNRYEKIFDEMIRCCKTGGRISIQDIIAYPDECVNKYFEELEKEIDISHNVTLPKDYIIDLFDRKDIEITSSFELEVELNFKDYLGHACQTEESLSKIKDLLELGLTDKKISEYFLMKDGDIYFKRPVFCILGKK